MEWLVTALVALFVALLVGSAFSAGGARGPWPNMLWFFVVLFLGTLAIGVWANPIGPRAWDVPWLGFLVIAAFVGLLIAAATPDYRHGRRHTKEMPLRRDTAYEPDPNSERPDPEEAEREAVGAAAAVSIFFWIFVIVAITIVAARILLEAPT